MKEPIVLMKHRRPLDPADYKSRSAREEDFEYLVTRPTVIHDEEQDKVTVVYLELDEPHKDLVDALLRIKYSEDARTNGMPSRSRTFGFAPRVTIRRDYCGPAALASEAPDVHDMILSYADKISRYYQRFHPELYADHQRQVERVLPDYKIGNSVFTSGIINKDNPLPYHHDSGNFKGVWSNMLVFKNGIKGGYLSVPEYEVGFQLKNNSLLMFDGQNLLHGVTPITRRHPDAHRFSIVFYSLQQMWQCLTPEEEVERIRKKRTEREKNRAARDRENV